MGFVVPVSAENADGWGPAADCVSEEYADVPYAPFNKSDKLGRAADWTQTGYGKFGGSAFPATRVPAPVSPLPCVRLAPNWRVEAALAPTLRGGSRPAPPCHQRSH